MFTRVHRSYLAQKADNLKPIYLTLPLIDCNSPTTMESHDIHNDPTKVPDLPDASTWQFMSMRYRHEMRAHGSLSTWGADMDPNGIAEVFQGVPEAGLCMNPFLKCPDDGHQEPTPNLASGSFQS